MHFLKDTKEFGKEDDEKTDGDDGGDDEFLSFTQVHGVHISCRLLLITISYWGL
jgi:hypothetical protein